MKTVVESNTVSVNALDVNKTTALHIAAREGHTDIISFLLEHGADVRLKDYKGRNPLQLAIEKEKE